MIQSGFSCDLRRSMRSKFSASKRSLGRPEARLAVIRSWCPMKGTSIPSSLKYVRFFQQSSNSTPGIEFRKSILFGSTPTITNASLGWKNSDSNCVGIPKFLKASSSLGWVSAEFRTSTSMSFVYRGSECIETATPPTTRNSTSLSNKADSSSIKSGVMVWQFSHRYSKLDHLAKRLQSSLWRGVFPKLVLDAVKIFVGNLAVGQKGLSLTNYFHTPIIG